MIRKEELVEIGKFQKTHALKGELNMISEIDPEYFSLGNPLIVKMEGIFVPFYVESVRPKGSTSYLVKLEGVNSEKEASEFVNKEIHMLKKDSDDWIDEEFEDPDYWIGYEIVDADSGEVIGTVEGVDYSTQNTLFIVKSPTNDEIFLPANEDFIVEINEETKTIRMDLPEGLLTLNMKD